MQPFCGPAAARTRDRWRATKAGGNLWPWSRRGLANVLLSCESLFPRPLFGPGAITLYIVTRPAGCAARILTPFCHHCLFTTPSSLLGWLAPAILGSPPSNSMLNPDVTKGVAFKGQISRPSCATWYRGHVSYTRQRLANQLGEEQQDRSWVITGEATSCLLGDSPLSKDQNSTSNSALQITALQLSLLSS